VNWRILVVLSSTTILLSLSAASFWLQDWQYSQPTPRPAEFTQPPLSQHVQLGTFGLPVADEKPVFLHFFNPSCPCSRFGLDHLRWLHSRYKGEIQFVAVLQGDTPNLQQEFDKLKLDMPSVVDTSKQIANATGVYSTPQAVLLDTDSRLYFRGNYNASRYCITPETAFAQIALESMLARKPLPAFPPAASTAYGCPLPRRKSASNPTS
jgi:thiol-disulfide isomerase/thioredoxin